MRKIRVICTVGLGLFLIGCGKTDLDQLIGTWGNENGDGLVIYEPYDSDEIYGDAIIIDNDDSTEASYEWDESRQRLIFTYYDKWRDRVNVTYKYNFLDTDTLEMTPLEYSDSINIYGYEDADSIEFEREE